MAQADNGRRAPAECACTRSFSIQATTNECSSPSPRRARFAPTMAARRGSRSTAACIHSTSPIRPPRSATAFTASRCTARARTCCSCRSTGTSCAATTPASRGTRSAAICRPTSGSPIDVHAHEPETDLRRADQERLGAFSARRQAARVPQPHGGNEWEALTKGLPQSDCYVNVLRDAMAVDSLDKCGVYFGTTGGQVYASADAGDNWAPIVRDLPAVVSVEVQTLP